MHLSSAGILTISSLPSDIELLSLTNTVTLTGAGAPAGRIAIVKVA
jgi:hypothetical protein